MFPEHIETDRLHLRRFDATVETLEYYRICAYDDGIEEATKHLIWDPHRHPKETKDFIEELHENWEAGTESRYAIVPKDGETDADTIAGTGGIGIDWDRQIAELGVFLRKRFWGRGYSGERAGALLTLAFDRLDLEIVHVGTMPENDRSLRAIEKYVDRFGGRREGRLRNHLECRDGPADMIRFSISDDEFEANRDEAGDVVIHDELA